MADVNANIGVHIDTSETLAKLKQLRSEISRFHQSVSKSSVAAAVAQRNLQTNLLNAVNATGKFHAQMGLVRTSTESFTHALETNKLSMRDYFRYGMGATKTFGKFFTKEFSTISQVAEDRVKRMQTQYIKMGRDASGAMKAIAITPTSLNMKDYGTQVALAAQKQALFNQLLKQGSTNLLNFGKNTQWAGRQLMVGFTIPLIYFGTTAGKVFMDLEAQAIKFRRVYGDMFTSTAETEKALADVQLLAKEFTKYGVAASKTIEMAAAAAAMGKTGADLLAQVQEATRLSVLGQVEQQQALETTISLTNAFGIAADDLRSKIDFLNVVENQTVLSIEDLTVAIPKAGPVIKQLGGSVEDLAFFMTAMKEGGINAAEGANALKSGLASLINPTDKASKMLAGFGINIKGIVEANKGNVKGIVLDFAAALDTLDPLNRARAIEQLFGKFQFARLSTLFQNVIKDGTQASRVLDMTGASVEELAILSERELKKVEDAVGTNFREALEQLKLTMAPVGKEFLKALTPVLKFIGGLLDKFNNLGDGAKKVVTVLTAVVGVIGPIFLMTFGLVMNAIANSIKLFALMRNGVLRLGGNSRILAEQTNYLTKEQLEATTVAAALDQAHNKLTQRFTSETSALQALRVALNDATVAQARFAAANPGMMIPGFTPRGGGVGGTRFRGIKTPGFAGGSIEVTGGTQGKDSVPALLMPGEAIIPTDVAQDKRVKPLIEALVTGNIAKYAGGSTEVSIADKVFNASTAKRAQGVRDFLNGLIYDEKTKSYTHINSKGNPVTFTQSRLLDVLSGRSLEKFTVSEIKEKLQTEAYYKKGKSVGTSRPPWVDKLMQKASYPNMVAEEQAIRNRFARLGINVPESKMANLFGSQASHIKPEVGADGRKVWRAANLVKDAGWANNYLNTVKGNLGKELLRLNDAQLTQLGIDRKELNKLVREIHPVTAKAASTLEAVARYQIAKYPNNPNIYQAEAVVAGMEYRKNSGFYPKRGIVATLADIKNIDQAKKKQQELLVDKETEAIRDKRTQSLTAITSKNSVPKKPNEQPVPYNAKDRWKVTIDPKTQEVVRIRGRQTIAGRSGIKGPNIRYLPGKADAPWTGTPGSWRGVDDWGDPIKDDQQQKVGGKKINEITQKFRTNLKDLSEKAAPKVSAAFTKVTDALDKQITKNEEARKQNQQNTNAVKQNTAAAAENTKTSRTFFEKGNIAAGALSGLTLAATFAGGSIGDAAAKLLPFVFGLQGLVALLPALQTKTGALTIGIAATLAAFIKLRMDFDNARREMIALKKATGASAEALQGYATFANKVNASEIMDRRRQNRFSLLQAAPGKSTFGGAFIQTEGGRGIVDAFAKQISKDKGKIATSVEDLTSQLATSVMAGALSVTQARSIATNIADELGNMTLGIQVSAKLNELLGPNGEKILTNGITIRANLIDQQKNRINTAAGAVGQGGFFTGATKLRQGMTIGGTASAGGAAGAYIGSSALPGLGTIVGAGIGTVIGAGVGYLMQKKGAKELGAQAGALAADMTNALAMQYQLQDALDLSFQTRIKESKAAGDTAKATELELQYIKEKNALDAKSLELNNKILSTYKNAGGAQEAILNATKEQAKNVYKDTAEARYVGAAQALLGGARKAGGMTSEEEFLVNLKIESKEILPSQVTTLLGMFEGKVPETKAVTTIITKFGGKLAGQAQQVLGLITDKQGNPNAELQSKVLLQINGAATSAEAQKIIDLVGTVGAVGGVMDADILINYYVTNQDVAKNVMATLDKIDASKDITLNIAYQLEPKTKGLVDEQYFNSLKDEVQQKLYTKTITLLVNTDLQTLVKSDDYQKWFVANEQMDGFTYGGQEFAGRRFSQGQLVNEYIKDQAMVVTQTGGTDITTPPTTATDLGDGKRDTTLDDLLTKLKRTRDATIDVTKGKSELLRVLGGNKDILAFKGLDQALIKVNGSTEDFINLVGGMEKAIQKGYVTVSQKGIVSLTELGKATKKGAAEVITGEFQVGIKAAIKQTEAQRIAFNKLTMAGLPAKDALEVVANGQLALVLATKQANKEIPTLVKNLLKLSQVQGPVDPLTQFREDMSKINEQLDIMEQEVRSRLQPAIDAINNNIDSKEKEIEALQRTAEIQFDRPIEVLQNQARALNHDLSIMDKIADAINAKYDQQAKALTQIQEINSRIAQQEKSKISLAGALTQGDIAAAAQAAQEIRTQDQQFAQEDAAKALELAREKELSAIRSASGLTRKQIEEQLYQISEQTYNLETQRQAVDLQIRTLQDEIYNLKVNQLATAQANLDRELAGIEAQRKRYAEAELAIRGAEVRTDAYTEALKRAEQVLLRMKALWATMGIGSVGTATTFSEISAGVKSGEITAENITSAQQQTIISGIKAKTAEINAKIAQIKKSIQGKQYGGIIKYMASGGPVGSDTVPAMLTPGEFVVNKSAANAFGPLLTAINESKYPSMLSAGMVSPTYSISAPNNIVTMPVNNSATSISDNSNTVYNYNVGISVGGTNVNPDRIARAVMDEIKYVDSQRIRNQRA